MGETITVVGGSNSAIAVTLDGSQAIELAKEFNTELDAFYRKNELNFLDVTEKPSNLDDNMVGYGVITKAGDDYTAGNGYKYIAVGGHNDFDPSKVMTPIQLNDANLLDGVVKIKSVMDSDQTVKILAGPLKGFSYTANAESGFLAAGNVDGAIIFKGDVDDGGDWTINTGHGNDSITTGSGDNIVNASLGKNTIDASSGITNMIHSEGQDVITATENSSALNYVTLTGGVSETSHAYVSLNSLASVSDQSFYNSVTVGGGSTIEGGTYANYEFNGKYNSNESLLNGGTNSTIQADGDLTAAHGENNTINAAKAFTALNPGGNNSTANVQGQAVLFGSEELNYTLNATGNASGLFVADVGNETLDASGSTVGLQIYANTVVGGNANLSVMGGAGDDLFTAGVGNSTFTGGAGNNLFVFTKDSATSTDGKIGNTVITDFSKNGSDNKIALYNYGLDDNSLTALLESSKNDEKGDAVLDLKGNNIIIKDVSVSDLTVDQFQVYNATTTKNS